MTGLAEFLRPEHLSKLLMQRLQFVDVAVAVFIARQGSLA